MDEKFELSNEMKNEKINASVLKTMKQMRILMIIGWCLLASFLITELNVSQTLISLVDTISNIGIYIIMVASSIIGLQLIRKQRVAHGVCLMIFGSFSFGIWPFVVATVEKNKVEHEEFDVSSKKFKTSLMGNYNATKILLIVGMATYIIYIGFWLVFIAGIIIAVQDFRRDKLAHGICIGLFGWLSFGIWPLVYSIKQKNALKNEISNENQQVSMEAKQENYNYVKSNTQKTNEIYDAPVEAIKVAPINENIQAGSISESHIIESNEKVDAEVINVIESNEVKSEEPIIEETIRATIDEQTDSFGKESSQKNLDNESTFKKGPIIGILAGVTVVLLICVVSLSVVSTKTSAAEYIIYDPIEVSATYTVPEVPAKEAIYSEPKVYEFVTGDVLICGEDIPLGEYTVETFGTNQFGDSTIVEYQEVGEGKWDGDSISNAEKFECEEGMQLRTWNDEGTFTLTSEKVLIEDAIDAIPAYDVNTEMTTTFNEDGSVNEITCTEDGSNVECKTLPTYDKLAAASKEVEDNKSHHVIVTETMEENVFSSTCTSTYVEEIECEEAVTYDELVESLE